MRILQHAVPAGKLNASNEEGLTATLCMFATVAVVMPPLIDDGASEGLFKRGFATANPPQVSVITDQIGLLLVAKDMDTLRRGLAAYPPNQYLTCSNSGLGLVAGNFDRDERVNVVKGFFDWGRERVKQSFLQGSYPIVQWMVKHGVKPWKRERAYKRVIDFYHYVGIQQKVTFSEFRDYFSADVSIMFRGSFIYVMRTADMDAKFQPPGCTVTRFINSKISVQSLGKYAHSPKT